MTQDADQVVVAANGSVHVADVGTAIADDPAQALGAGWTELGYVTEDGVTLTDSKTQENINAWQSFYPIRRIITERDFQLAFVLRQWAGENVMLAFGGGVVADEGGGVYSYTPPDPEELDERSLVVDWADGTKLYRLHIPKGQVTENVESTLARSAAADLPITFSVTAEEGAEPWQLFTNDPAFAPAGS